MKGSGFLKVTGILMIIGGVLGILAGALGLTSAAGAAAYFELAYEMGMGDQLNALVAASVLCLVSGVLQIIAGILGVKNCNNPARAKTCLAWGVIVAVLSIIGNIFSAVGTGDANAMYLVTGLLLPALYIYGAYANSRQV